MRQPIVITAGERLGDVVHSKLGVTRQRQTPALLQCDLRMTSHQVHVAAVRRHSSVPRLECDLRVLVFNNNVDYCNKGYFEYPLQSNGTN